MENKYGFIYITTNKVNGKKYIGQHTRFKEDYLGSGILLARSIKKYGVENFSREIIEFADSKSELDLLEKEYINRLNATVNKNFYNIHVGGSGGLTTAGWTDERRKKFSEAVSNRVKGSGNPRYGKKLSESTRQKISDKQIAYAKRRSPEATQQLREKVSKASKGENNGMFGKKHSAEAKNKMSENSLGKVAGNKNGMFGKTGDQAINGQEIKMYDENKNLVRTFQTVGKAKEFLNVVGHASLYKACKNNTMYKGYYWEKNSRKTK